MDKITVGIIGGGVVGSAMAHVYDRPDVGVTCKLYDILYERSRYPLNEVIACDVIMVCLPTPLNETASGLDIKAIEEFFGKISSSRKIVILRSTVPIGTCRRLSNKFDLPYLLHMPEFLTERTALEDAESPAGIIVGSRSGDLPDIAINLLKVIYLYDEPLAAPYEHVEMAKLATNAFFAVKVSFFNEVRLLSDKIFSGGSLEPISQAHYDLIRDLMLTASYMVGDSHTQVPGPDGMRGFGGKCLPKDTSQFIKHLFDNKVGPVMCVGAMVRCAHDRRPSSQETKNEASLASNPT